MPLTTPLSASTAIAARHRLEALSAQVREASACILDVAQLADAVTLFDRVADAGRQAAVLAKRLSDAQDALSAETYARAMENCSLAAGAAICAAETALTVVQTLASTSRRKPGRRTREFTLEIDATFRRLLHEKP